MAEESVEAKVKKQIRSVVPRKEVDIITVASHASTVWKVSGLTLRWTTPEELEENTTTFKTTFDAGRKTSGERRVVTQSLGTINTIIDKALKHVKGYIADAFDANEIHAYYAQFGIVKQKRLYIIPRDNDSRQQALEQMVKAIEQHGMADRRYGKVFWTDVRSRFIEAKGGASTLDSTSAAQVSIKIDVKAYIIKTLQALVCLVKANYPDTWHEEIRVWGFQKEKY